MKVTRFLSLALVCIMLMSCVAFAEGTDDPYAPPVEYGHGGPVPAPAHPFIRPAYDTRSDEAYEIIRDGLRDAIDQL